MDSKTDDHGHKERRKQRGTSSGTQAIDRTRPPDKKKLEKDLTAINRIIADKESNLKLISWNPTQTLFVEINRMSSELAEAEKEKKENTATVERIEAELASLGREVIEKKDEASKLIAGVRHKTEEKIDEAVSKLELQLHTRRYSATEERKVQFDIDSLTKSKKRLRAYYQKKDEIDEMRTRQESLRKQRDALYRANGELRERIGTLRDSIADKKTELDQLKERKKVALARKDAIEKEIDELKKQRRQLLEDFRQRQMLHSQAASEEKQQLQHEEEERRQPRREERLSRRKQPLDLLYPRRPQYHEEKQVCTTLIDYVQRISLNHASSDTPSSPSLVRPLKDQSSQPGGKPGEFLPRKGEEEGQEFLVPVMARKKSKRDKRRHTVSGKTGKRLNHNAATVRQFSYLGLVPPSSYPDLPEVLAKLQEKLTFYTSKSQSGLMAESEAGDSGVDSTAFSELHELSDADLPTPLTISQEDVSSEGLISPKRSLTESLNGLKINALPDRSVSDNTSLAPQTTMVPNGTGLVTVSHPSSNSLATQSSSSSSVAMVTGLDE